MDFRAELPMNVQAPSESNCSCYQELRHAFSFKRCCYFILIFLLLVAAMVGISIFTIILILKPKKPIFSLQTLTIDSFELNTSSSSNIYVSCAVSMTLNARNPNKVGLRYSSSRLHILYSGIPIGALEVPQFYQPAHSKNMSVQTRLVLEHLSIDQITGGVSLKKKSSMSGRNLVELRVVGDIRARVRIFHVTLPRIKVSLDCKINVNYQSLMFNSEIYTMKENHKDHAVTKSSTFFTKCSLAVCI